MELARGLIILYALRDNYLEGKIFNVGIYLRVSREDENSSESESIVNQKELLTRYVIKNGWNLTEYYIDDGFTGTNFERPGFKKLLRDIENKRINMVVTKDLSRLGRDYIETGYYFERFFPEKGIRYIAINDGLDTFDFNNNNNDMSPFKSVINDMYAKDISKKVRTSFNSKKESGKFIGAFAPYGYRKSPTDKNKLVVDEKTAPVARRIFDMYLEGSGYSKIAHILNDEGIIPPSMYKAENTNYRNKTKVGLWTHGTVSKILSNPTYAGHLTQNKYYKTSYKVKKLKNVPKSSWITVENTHEAIVDQSIFDKVQDMMNKKTNTNQSGSRRKHLLSGLILCGDCGGRMTFTTTQKGVSYSICSRYKRFNLCSRHSIMEEELDNYILSELRSIAQEVLDKERLMKAAESKNKIQKHSSVDNKLSSIESRLEEIKRVLKKLYEDKIKGIVTEQDYIDFSNDYNKEREQLNKRLEKFGVKKPHYEQMQKENDRLAELVKGIIEFENAGKSILVQLIEKIEVFEDKETRVYYKFCNPF
jgi:site-specific DNA recombinase